LISLNLNHARYEEIHFSKSPELPRAYFLKKKQKATALQRKRNGNHLKKCFKSWLMRSFNEVVQTYSAVFSESTLAVSLTHEG